MLHAWTLMGNPSATPSARVLATIDQDFDRSYLAFVRAQSEQTRAAILALPDSDQLQNRFTALSQASIAEQKQIESGDTLPFEM